MSKLIKTGEVFDQDEDGTLFICESWLNEETKETTTTRNIVQAENTVED